MAQFTAYPQDTMLAFFMNRMCGLGYIWQHASGVVKDAAGQTIAGPLQPTQMGLNNAEVDPAETLIDLNKKLQDVTKQIQDYETRIKRLKEAASSALKSNRPNAKDTAVQFLKQIPEQEKTLKAKRSTQQQYIASIEAIKSNQQALETNNTLNTVARTLENQHTQISPAMINRTQTEFKLHMEQADETRHYMTNTGVPLSSMTPQMSDDEYISMYLSMPAATTPAATATTDPIITSDQTKVSTPPAKNPVAVNSRLLQLAGGNKGSGGSA